MPTGINKVVGLAMPATWSFDTMKRFSTLDTLEEDGALKNGETNGLGLYKFIEEENKVIIEKAKKDIKDYESKLETKFKTAETKSRRGETLEYDDLRMTEERPQIKDAEKIPETNKKIECNEISNEKWTGVDFEIRTRV